MLNKKQTETFESLTDEFVDQQEVEGEESVKEALESIKDQGEMEIWNTTVGTSAPAISGASDPSCPQDGNDPCASCDCC